jgi:hypothetical protein
MEAGELQKPDMVTMRIARGIECMNEYAIPARAMPINPAAR